MFRRYIWHNKQAIINMNHVSQVIQSKNKIVFQYAISPAHQGTMFLGSGWFGSQSNETTVTYNNEEEARAEFEGIYQSLKEKNS